MRVNHYHWQRVNLLLRQTKTPFKKKKVDFVMNMKVKEKTGEDKNIQGKSEKKDGKKEPRKAHTCSYNRFLFPLGTVLYLLLLVLDQ